MITARTRSLICSAVLAAVAAPSVHAADLYWQGGAGSLDAANYYSPTAVPPTNVVPTATDILYIGENGQATVATGQALSYDRLRLGHNSTAGGTEALPGAGTLDVTGGTLNLAGVVGEPVNGGLFVGHNATGTLNISGGVVTAAFYGKVGYDDNTADASTGAGFLNVSGNGDLLINARGLNIGEGMPGHVTLSDSGRIRALNNANGNLSIGVDATSAFTQTGGTTVARTRVRVGDNAASNSSLSISGGSFSGGAILVAPVSASGVTFSATGTATVTTTNNTNLGGDNGKIEVAMGSATGTTWLVSDTASVTIVGGIDVAAGTASGTNFTISGNATLTGGAGITIGGGDSVNTTATFSGASVTNLANGLTAGLGAAANTTLTIADTATINLATAGASNVHLFLGRGTSANTTLNMTGGTLNVPNYVLIGTATGPDVTTTTNHSGGTITAGTNLAPTGPDPITVRVGFKIGDTSGTHAYNLSGTGAVVVANGPLLVGRQGSTATVNQTGGSITANGGVHVGESESTDTATMTATGTYAISAGTLTAASTGAFPAASFPHALSIGNAGTGTLRVIGDDATIDINGNMLVNSADTRTGALAFQLEAGDPGLSKIDVSGTATFSAGSVLSLDLNGLTPAATSFDLLTAADIVDNGLVFSAPAGWSFQILAGGNGELLRALSTPAQVAGDVNGDGVVNLGDINYVTARWLNAGPAGDANNDGVVNLGDINYITARWLNTSEPGGVSVAALAAVPEPTTLSLLTLATLPLLTRRRRA